MPTAPIAVTGPSARTGRRRDARGPSPGRSNGCRVITRNAATQPPPTVLRIGEVAKLTGLTTRTLRYWEEQGLISPSAYRGRASGSTRPRTWPGSPASRTCRAADLAG